MYNRFQIALDIQNATNLAGVARELVKAIDDARKESPNLDARGDCAVLLIVDKIYDMVGRDCGMAQYSRITEQCETRARALSQGSN